MEKAGMPGASFHIADPNGPFGNRGKWAADPVEFWRQVVGLEHVLQRHPDLVVIAAHCAWLICQDAQIDYLRYMLSTYPNFRSEWRKPVCRELHFILPILMDHLVTEGNGQLIRLNFGGRL